MTNETIFSHQQLRAFQPQKLSAPRDFKMPSILDDETNVKDALKTSSQTLVNSLMLEIGAGKGKHALMYATQNPDKHIIAIERTRHKFNAFDKIVASRCLSNLTPVHADAIAWIVHAIKPQSVACIYILYPNPEPHNPNQQWLNMPFFEFLLSRLQVSGQIILATNIESYMDNAERQAIETWQLPCVRQRVAHDSQRTHFEIKYLARQETCWQLTMSKPEEYKTRFDD